MILQVGTQRKQKQNKPVQWLTGKKACRISFKDQNMESMQVGEASKQVWQLINE